MTRNFRISLLSTAASVAVATLAVPGISLAAEPTDQSQIEEVVVTGTAQPEGMRKLDASFSITTANADQIREAAPSSTADLLKITPGLFAETTGGVSGANIEVRGFPTGGDAPFATVELDGSPLYASPTLSFLETSTLFRLDDTVSRVEVLRGGPSPIWSSGQPGVTVNFIQKNGQTDPGGSLRITVGSGDERRVDGYFGGEIASGWYGSIGGFYRTDTGVRDTQFPADEGYQLSGTLIRDIKDGKVTFYGRVTHDENAFFTPIPLISRNNGRDISAFPGFDPLTGSLLGDANRIVTFETTPGSTPGTLTMDMSKGRGLDTHLFGMDIEKKYGGWNFSNKANFNEGDLPTFALFTGNNPQTLGDFINAAVARANSNPAVVAAAGGPATGGSATFANTGKPITDLNIQVIDPGAWHVVKRLRSFTDDARVSREIFSGNTVTAGIYFASYSSKDNWNLGNGFLMTVQNNAVPVDVVLNNGAKVTLHGIDSPTFFALNASYNGQNIAGTIADEWQITDKLRVDAGFREEHQLVDATIENDTSADLDGNPATLYDNNASVPNGTFRTIHNTSGTSSWTVGADYAFTHSLNAFVRYNQGYLLPQFDDFRNGISSTERIKQVEGGVKTVTDLYSLFLTGFYNDFTGQPQLQILQSGQEISFLLGSKAYGAEFEASIRPIDHFQIDFTGDYNHARYENDPGFSGNKVQRQPEFQFRLTPSYTYPVFDSGFVRVYTTYTHVGSRFADVGNQQFLPAYETLDVGAELALNDSIELDFTGTNVTNKLGITEGNSRVIGSGSSAGGVFLGRPLFGATYEASVVVRF